MYPDDSPEHRDREAFRRLERCGWKRAAASYGGVWGPLTRQFAEPLLDAVRTGPGQRLLDVACGPGYLAAAAAARGADAVGVDFTPSMVAEARRLHPRIEFRRADAEELPFSAASFDAVVINFGVLHFADPDRALAEARRVLSPGGRLAFTAWDADESPGGRMIREAIRAHADLEVGLPQGPPVDRFADPEECRRSLAAAGFEKDSLRASSVQGTWRVASSDEVFDAELRHGVRLAALLARQRPQVLDAIRRAIARALDPFACCGGYLLPMTARLVTAAVRPSVRAAPRAG